MKKSSHSFLCRDDVWERVEALAKHRQVSTDDVVQAALVQLFVRKRRPPPPAAPAAPAGRRSTLPPAAPASGSADESMSRTIPDFSMSPSQAKDLVAGFRSGPTRPPSAPVPDAAPAPHDSSPSAPLFAAEGEARPLYLHCGGEWYVIDKDEFVIGRGKKYSDLAIKDANISRRHCAITRIDGQYFMRDLGSTNGIEQDGQPVEHDHEILEDSVFQLCSHELRFSYQEPLGPVIKVGA